MRVLMLAQFYPPIIGGEERHVRNLSLALAARGHSVAVATLQQPGLAGYEEDEGQVRLYRLKGTVQRLESLFSESGRRHAPPFPDPETVLALQKVIAAEKPQIIHAHNWLAYAYLPLKPLFNVPLVMTLHDYSLVCARKRLMYQEELCSGPGLRKCLECSITHYGRLKGPVTAASTALMGVPLRRAVSRFMPVSQAVAEGVGLSGSKWPFQVMPNFVPDALTDPTSQVVRPEDQPYLARLPQGDFLMFAGDLSRDKGVDVLLAAYTRLSEKLKLPLVLIGRRGEETPAADKLPAGATILENWPHSALMAAWRRSLLALAPSIWPDPCPTVAMEAMASGRAVIGSWIGGLTDIIAHEESGLLVPPGDSAALSEAIARLITNRQWREQLGQGALARVSRFQAGSVVPQIEQVYRQITGLAPAEDRELPIPVVETVKKR